MKLTILLTTLIFSLSVYSNTIHNHMIDAAYFGETATLVEIIKTNQVDINYQDSEGRTAIWYAGYWEYVDTMKVILAQKDVDVNIPDHYGIYIIDWVSYEGKWESYDLLKAAGAVEH